MSFKTVFFITLSILAVTFGIIEYRENYTMVPVHNSELQHRIQNVTCVQSKYWICDVRINDSVVLGYRSPVELQIGDKMWLIHKDNRTYLFGK